MTDPVLARRERIRKLTELGQRFGYSCFALAMVLFVIAFIAQFPGVDGATSDRGLWLFVVGVIVVMFAMVRKARAALLCSTHEEGVHY